MNKHSASASPLFSILAGILATPSIVIMTLGIGLSTGINMHFLLFSILIANIVGIILNPQSSNFFNIGPGLVVNMFVINDSIGLNSGFLSNFIIFAIPGIIFTVLSFLSFDFKQIPKRVIAVIAFGIGLIIFIKQIPIAFSYNEWVADFSDFEEGSAFANATIQNWIQLIIAFSIPTAAILALRYKKSHIALVLATLVALTLGYLLGYKDSSLIVSELAFESFRFNWTISQEVMLESIKNGISLSIIMGIYFWCDFSILHFDQKENVENIKTNLKVVGIGNLCSGIFGMIPTNISLTDSLFIRAFGGKGWISKLPIIIILTVIAIVGLPDFDIPLFVFAGVLLYIAILLFIKTWNIVKDLHWIEYIFIFLISVVFLLTDFLSAFFIAVIYAVICNIIEARKASS